MNRKMTSPEETMRDAQRLLDLMNNKKYGSSRAAAALMNCLFSIAVDRGTIHNMNAAKYLCDALMEELGLRDTLHTSAPNGTLENRSFGKV